MELDNNKHSVFSLNYHLILVVKHRRQIFENNISNYKFLLIYKDCLLTEECEEIMVTATIFRLWRMSLQGSVLILVILAARRFLKQYSKIYSYSLWILALISL